MISEITGVDSLYEVPDVLWNRITPLLPPRNRKRKKAGRPRMNDRKAMSAIFYVLRTGCQWNALPRSLGASSTVHDRFQEWRKAGVFKRMWIDSLLLYDKESGIDWKWQAMDDGVITKVPLGGKGTGANPTDRAKSGTKRSVLVDGKGVPISVSVDGANRHDMKMSKATLQSIVIYRPKPTMRSKQHMCLDKGYDFPEVYELLEEYEYTIHIPLRGEKTSNKRNTIPGYRARHWVVERTYSWMNRFRRLLIRWDKKVENHIAMLHFACAWITYRRAGVFG